MINITTDTSLDTRLQDSPYVPYDSKQSLQGWIQFMHSASDSCSSENMQDLKDKQWAPIDLTKLSPKITKKIEEIQEECSKPTPNIKKIHELTLNVLRSITQSPSFSPVVTNHKTSL